MPLQLSRPSEDVGVTGVEEVEVPKRITCLEDLAALFVLPRQAGKIVGFLVRLTRKLHGSLESRRRHQWTAPPLAAMLFKESLEIPLLVIAVEIVSTCILICLARQCQISLGLPVMANNGHDKRTLWRRQQIAYGIIEIVAVADLDFWVLESKPLFQSRVGDRISRDWEDRIVWSELQRTR